MRKNALVMCCYVCVAAAFGAFFRWIQNMAAFETETGLYIPGSLWSKVLVLVCVAVLAGLLGLVVGLQKKQYLPAENCAAAFRGTTPLPPYLYTVLGVVMVLGGLILFVTSKYQTLQTVLRLLAFLTVLAGAGFAHMMAAPYKKRESAMLCLSSGLLVILGCFWLVVSYKLHSNDPSAWSYGMEIMAIGADTIGFYYLAGYAFGRVRPYRTVFFGLAGALLSLITLVDDRTLGMQMMFVACAGMLMYACWMIIANMRIEKAVIDRIVEKE